MMYRELDMKALNFALG